MFKSLVHARAPLRLIGLLALAWIVMTTTHELGHVVAGLASGATLTQLHLAPLPHSSYDPNPHPNLTLWGGPILGCVVPLLTAFAIARLRPPTCPLVPVARFVAHFCLLANGTYLALAWITRDPTLDTARLLHAGTPPAAIAAFCLVTIALGYARFRHDVQRLFRQNA